ncbi:MAG: bifunctional (p)ppGpp synthetase/guanosine-3',5'-bis(diphosphate) 3'-pyrophosphohydrolase, partial [Prolixibacteraceae bacterium]|nr:bifunctional (p)ppGpp synthetase/guanosine-3',5'-bis(diphosphate) 3'-pyrophosphohydrolase [Prolixibacteraceae bacterium]
KVLLTLSEDVRIILIKMADRLHNMRTLESMPPHKQIKVAGETLYIYAPLAHRLGLHTIKSELEDLALKYKNPEEYNRILYQLQDQEANRNYLIKAFIEPLEERLKIENIDCSISSRLKSIYSIWEKMQKKGVSFDEVYDILAIRIIVKPKPGISEKRQCFDILSILTDIYKPKPDRIRDWITMPKANGYESLHVTVMGPQGRWVEVQIRSERMERIAEHGFAAHYKYKGHDSQEKEMDKWLEMIREILQSPDTDAYEFLDEFKLNLFASEIAVFSPKGELFNLPKDSTVLDFAFEIHTDLGNKCIGAKVNQKLRPISYVLNSGDQVEILTSEKQKPQIEWLKIASTAKARNKIKNAFKMEKSRHLQLGKEMVEAELKKLNIIPTTNTLKKMTAHYNLSNKDQLYSQVGMGFIELNDIENIVKIKSENRITRYWKLTFSRKKKTDEKGAGNIDKKKPFLLREEPESETYSLAKCCNPIPGDDVIGYILANDQIIIHKKDCPKAEKFISSHGDRLITAKWTNFKKLSYLTQLRLNGFDRVGIVNEVTNVISKLHNINMRTVKFDTHDGIFEGDLYIYIHNAQDLQKLISELNKLKGINKIERVEHISE